MENMDISHQQSEFLEKGFKIHKTQFALICLNLLLICALFFSNKRVKFDISMFVSGIWLFYGIVNREIYIVLICFSIIFFIIHQHGSNLRVFSI